MVLLPFVLYMYSCRDIDTIHHHSDRSGSTLRNRFCNLSEERITAVARKTTLYIYLYTQKGARGKAPGLKRQNTR